MTIFRNNLNSSNIPLTINGPTILPLFEESIALRTMNVRAIDTASIVYPQVVGDPTAAVVDEGAEFVPSDMVFDELEVKPVKIGALTRVTSESIEDSDPTTSEVVGEAIERELARKLDTGIYGTLAGFSGLNGLTGFTNVPVANTSWAKNTDPFVTAYHMAAAFGANLSVFVANPTDALALALMKESGSTTNNLLQPVPTEDGIIQTVAGVALFESPYVPVGTIYGYDPRYVDLVMRQNVRIDPSPHEEFSSDKILIRGKMRAALGVKDARTVVKIVKGS